MRRIFQFVPGLTIHEEIILIGSMKENSRKTLILNFPSDLAAGEFRGLDALKMYDRDTLVSLFVGITEK